MKQMFDIISIGDDKMKTVKDLKQEIDKIMLPGYTYKTNLNWSEHLIDINNGLGIGTKLVQVEDKIFYEFIIDTQFLSLQEITYDEVILCKNIMEILEKNKNFVLKRLKKYTFEEYKQEQLELKQRQENLLVFLDSLIHKN